MQALILEQQDGKTLASVQPLDENQLPEGDVTVDVHWSSLNYKDALAITGKGKIIRNFPMIPGIDFAGTVRHSEDPRFHAGQEVLLTGWGVGENHWGGLSERARVKGDWLVALPNGLSSRNAMIIGTAGFTAMLCVMALEDAGIRPQDELARKCGIAVGDRGGIVVDNHCVTSVPDVYSIGESALWQNRIYGLVAPGYHMAKVAVSHITGGSEEFTGADMSTKLKLLGVDVGSVGDAHANPPGSLSYTYSNDVEEVYKRIIVKEKD